jgi:zinc protease
MKLLSVALLVCVLQVPLRAQLKLPPYSKTKLKNGATLIVMERKGVPLVNIDVAIRGGKESEPVNEPGVAAITADLLRKGTAQYTAEQFSVALDSLGGTFRTRSDEQSTVLESEFLAKDVKEGLTLMVDAVLHPTFPAGEVTKLLAQRRDDIKSLKDNPERAISPYAHAFFFGNGHPYGRIVNEKSLDSLSREAIVAYHHRMYGSKNLIMAVVGDVDAAAVKQEAERIFGASGTATGDAYQWGSQVPISRPAQDRLQLVDKPGATQTYFYIVQPGIDAANPDRVTLRLVNTLFGGRFTSMLNEELRVKSGLTYGASNHLDSNRLQGMNAISTFTKTDSTGRAIQLSLSTLQELRTNGITAEQLSSAKAYLKGTLPRETLETGDQLARLLIRLDVLGQGDDEVNDLFQRIDAVSVAQANAAIQKYFQTGGLTFVLVGDAARIRSALTQFVPQMEEVPISKPGFGVATN